MISFIVIVRSLSCNMQAQFCLHAAKATGLAVRFSMLFAMGGDIAHMQVIIGLAHY